MTTAAGLRDQLLRCYAKSDAGVNGVVRPVYNFTAEWWARLDESSVAVRLMSERLHMQLDAIAELADEAEIPTLGVLKDPDGIMWWIRGINRVRILRRVVVGLERIAEEEYASFEMFEGASVEDGVHMVDPLIAPDNDTP